MVYLYKGVPQNHHSRDEQQAKPKDKISYLVFTFLVNGQFHPLTVVPHCNSGSLYNYSSICGDMDKLAHRKIHVRCYLQHGYTLGKKKKNTDHKYNSVANLITDVQPKPVIIFRYALLLALESYQKPLKIREQCHL